MGFPRQEYWSGLPFPSPRDLSNSDWTHVSCTGRSLYCWSTREAPASLYWRAFFVSLGEIYSRQMFREFITSPLPQQHPTSAVGSWCISTLAHWVECFRDTGVPTSFPRIWWWALGNSMVICRIPPRDQAPVVYSGSLLDDASVIRGFSYPFSLPHSHRCFLASYMEWTTYTQILV